MDTRRFLLPLSLPALSLLLYAIYFVSVVGPYPALHHQLVEEDRAGEYAQFLLYLGASLLFFAGASGQPDRLSRVSRYGFAAFLFLLAGEEISWGYRLLGYSVPMIQRANARGDVDLHNLADLYGKWGYYPAFCLMLGVGVPLVEKLLRRRSPSYTPVTHHTGFIVTMLFVGVLCTLMAGSERFAYGFEFSELILALAFFWIASAGLRATAIPRSA